VIDLPAKIVELHKHLAQAQLPHAFGGALALAWCTGQARATIDIDINVFVPIDRMDDVFAAFPKAIAATKEQRKVLKRDGQVRLWWEQTPVDLFLNTLPFHESVAGRCRFETFMEQPVPFLACQDLAVFKAFFNRTKDWADLEAMQDAGTLDKPTVAAILIDHLGQDDERIATLMAVGQ